MRSGRVGEYVSLAHNERDQATRAAIVAEAERRLAVLEQLDGTAHTKAVCGLRAHCAHRAVDRYIHQTNSGKLGLDRSTIKQEAKLDGKYLVSASDEDPATEDVALGYKQPFEIERVNRDLKHTVEVRPVYHRKSDRIMTHVLLCWLALLLIRVMENETGQTWHQLEGVLRPQSVGYHHSEHGPIGPTNRSTPAQKDVLDALHLKPPARFLEIPTPHKAA